jgi:hypothetical protein
MSAGIQPQGVQQGGGAGSALADIVKVLYEPVPVFERVRERPKFLLPFIAVVAVQLVLYFVNMPYIKAATAAQMAARQVPAGGPDPMSFLWIGAVAIPIVFAIIYLINGLVLWVLTSLTGGEGKFATLLSVAVYASIPAVILMSIVGSIVLRMKGVGEITSQQDLQPSLGLDLLVPASGFVGAVLKGINPFGIWALVLTAIGVTTTHRISKGSGYVVATVSFVITLLIGGLFASMGGGR